MKQYKFEFDKFVKDLEDRNKKHQQIIEESLIEEENNYARKRVERYRELPQNQIVYDKDRSDAAK